MSADPRRTVHGPQRPPTPHGARATTLAGAATAALLVTGCAGIQSATDPRGPQAASINELWWLFLIVCTMVWVAVTVALFLALFRRGRRELDAPPTDGEPAKVRVVSYAVVATVAILVVFLVYSVAIGSRISRLPGPDRQPITVEVVGHQWWWEVRYLDDQASLTFTTANELRIPVGRPVILHLKSRDVIHSFWVPNLHGKMDLVPGRTNITWMQADTPGVFRGQCGEFCGLQHAKMAFMVVAEPVEAFEAWREAYRQPAPPRADPVAQRGEEVFLQAQCSMCHTIRGTGAWGRVGPDLTRIGARRTIAAGTLTNTRGNMGGWILDPQHIKPGNFMPATPLDPDSLQALLFYLESLK
jgi:cytochrome c oxidase subunit II